MDAMKPSHTNGSREGLGSVPTERVDSVYDVLHVPSVTLSPGENDSSTDAKLHRSSQEAPTSQAVIENVAEHPMQIDTVYSVLQRPKNLKT